MVLTTNQIFTKTFFSISYFQDFSTQSFGRRRHYFNRSAGETVSLSRGGASDTLK